MKMKRVWSALLAACLLLSLLTVGFTAAADESLEIDPDVPVIEILNPPVAEIGKTPENVTATVPEGAKYTVELSWHRFYSDNGEPSRVLMDSNEVFEDGKAYIRLWDITVDADWEGWAYAEDDGEIYVQLVIDGALYDTTYIFEDGTRTCDTDVFDFTEAIESVDISGFPVPVLGETASVEGLTVSAEGYEETEQPLTFTAMWRVDEGDIEWTEFTGTFEEGNRYYLDVDCVAKDGYSISDDCVLTVNGEETDADYWTGTFALEADIYYDFRKMLESIEITGVTDAVIGETATVDGIEVLVTGAGEGDDPLTAEATWFVYDIAVDDWVPFEGTFVKGSEYYLEIYLQLDIEYGFADDCLVTLDGEEIEDYSLYDEGAWIFLEYDFTEKIEAIEIVGVTDAVIGETATTDGIAVKIEGVDDAGEFVNVTAGWSVNLPEEGWSEFDGVFEKGMEYCLDVYLMPTIGYSFPDDCVVTYNGEELGEENISTYDGFLTVSLYYDFREKIEKVEITNTEKAVAGETTSVKGVTIPDDAHYSIVAMWMEAGNEDEDTGIFVGEFEEGAIYVLTIAVMPEEGYSLDDAAVFVNGKEASEDMAINLGGMLLVIADAAIVGDEKIEKVEITAKPEVGKTPEDVIVSVPEDAPYSVDEYEWVDIETGELVEGAFEADKVYGLIVSLITDDGYYMGIDVVIAINGEIVSDLENKENAITEMSFAVKVEAVESTTTKPTTKPSVEETLDSPQTGVAGMALPLFAVMLFAAVGMALVLKRTKA